MQRDALISLHGVSMELGQTKAVDDLTRSVPRGQRRDLWPLGTERVGKDHDHQPQLSFLYPNLSVAENLNFTASLYGLGLFRRGRRLRHLLEIVELWPHRGKLVRQLSGGMRKRLSLACALVQNPALIFLDEPTAGIDPILRQRFWELFRQLRDEGRTLLVTSHYVGEAEYCDEVAIIAEGRLAARGSPDELRREALGGDALDVTTRGFTLESLRVAREVSGVKRVEPLSLTTMRLFVSGTGRSAAGRCPP